MDVALDEPAIASIRRATRYRHEALEGVLGLGPTLSHRRYLNALRGFEAFLSAWEPRIEAALPAVLRQEFASRSRRRLLRRDLEQLHAEPLPPERRQMCEQAVSRIDLDGAAAVFGSMYVLEGSALGGQVIARLALSTLGFDADHGAAYFSGLDRHAAARWTAFRALFEEHVGIGPKEREQACDAGVQTFDALITTFSDLP